MIYLKLDNISKLAISGLILSFAMTQTAFSKPDRTKEQIQQEQNALYKAVQKGDQLWHDPSLGSNSLACANCHPDGSATNPHTWPKYQTNLGKVATMREMINWCIAVPLAGMPLELDSDEMIAMESYATYTHRGVALAPGKDEQHGAVPVAGGVGYLTSAQKEFEPAAAATTQIKKEEPKKAIGDLDLAKASGCLACHNVEKKVVGPAWRDVSKLYKGKSDARDFLINKVKNGGNGNWNKITGGFKMPANYPRVSEEDITLLVDFVLSLEK